MVMVILLVEYQSSIKRLLDYLMIVGHLHQLNQLHCVALLFEQSYRRRHLYQWTVHY